MILCLDIGNTQIYGGVFENDKLILRFRKSSKIGITSDEIGLFFRSVLKENKIEPEKIEQIAMCSVVPDIVYSIRNGCIKYFNIEPFILQVGVKTGLKIKYSNPQEVGSDRIANALAATKLYPNRNLIVIDLGTATTLDVISKNKEYLGGTITPGIKISMDVLASKTAKLPTVEITVPQNVIGKSTKESIQAGLFFGQVGLIRELISKITDEAFSGDSPIIIGTGGFTHMFEASNLFHVIEPDLVLNGILYALKINS
jgi:type III pantothenate kinase